MDYNVGVKGRGVNRILQRDQGKSRFPSGMTNRCK
jgi:hypothetical protein